MTRLLLLLAALPAAASAQTVELSHTGRLLSAAGEPLHGSIDLSVALYPASTGGAAVWEATFAEVPLDTGFYELTLSVDDDGDTIQDALFGSAGELWIAIATTDTPNPTRTKLASSPRALVASSVSTPGAVLDPEGHLIVRHTTESSCDTAGELAYNPTTQTLLLCDGASFGPTFRRTIASSGGIRQWSDGTWARSCDDYRHPSVGEYLGDVGSGVYRIDPEGQGPVDVYCDMTTNGGGWTLVLNLASGEDGRYDWNNGTFWTAVSTVGTAATAMTNDHKSRAFDRVVDTDEIMVYVHDEGSTEYGYAIYPLLTAHVGKSFRTLMNSGNNFVPVSDATLRINTTPIGTHRNTNRLQSLHGDIFVDHAGALSLNDTAGWGADQNYTRIATTLSNGDYVHTFAGLGIDHIEGGWGADVESAPISAYCAVEHGYGGPGQGVANGQASFPYNSTCPIDDGSSFAWLPVDHALFVR